METTTTQPQPTAVPEPQAEHRWLQQLVGAWTLDGEATMELGQPPATFTGTESVWLLGASGFWPRGRARCPGAALQRR